MRKLVLPDDRDREVDMLRGTGSDRAGSQVQGQPAHSQEEQQRLRRSNRLAGHHGVL